MNTRDDWLRLQLAVLEARVKEERQRLHNEREKRAREALIQMSLPELLGEVRDGQPDALEQPVSIH